MSPLPLPIPMLQPHPPTNPQTNKKENMAVRVTFLNPNCSLTLSQGIGIDPNLTPTQPWSIQRWANSNSNQYVGFFLLLFLIIIIIILGVGDLDEKNGGSHGLSWGSMGGGSIWSFLIKNNEKVENLIIMFAISYNRESSILIFLIHLEPGLWGSDAPSYDQFKPFVLITRGLAPSQIWQ